LGYSSFHNLKIDEFANATLLFQNLERSRVISDLRVTGREKIPKPPPPPSPK